MNDSESEPTTSMQTTPTPPPTPPQPKIKKSKSYSALALLACLLAVIALAGSGFAYMKAADKTEKDKQASEVKDLQDKIKKLEAANDYEKLAVDKDRFQAVFLVSGQVYFGKITDDNKDTIKLEDIYYLRNGTFDKTGNVSGEDVSLAKLGSEIHGPDDVMYIERKNLEFWENLKDDSQVVKAIKDYEKNN